MRTFFAALLGLALAPPLYADDAKKTEAKTSSPNGGLVTKYVPYRLTNTNHILVRVKINGKGPYNFILDTGAPALFVSTAVCRKLGITADKEGWGTFDRYEIEGGVVLKKAKGRVEDPFQLEGMNGLGLAGAELHGIIGYTVLARYRLEFDFTKHKMAWKELNFDPPLPMGLGGKAVAGMDALGGMMKLLGAMLGKRPEQVVVLRGFLGFALADEDNAVVVKAVLAKSPAADAGLKTGDRISQFQGQPVDSAAEVHRLAAKLAPYEITTFTVTRGSDTHTIRITAGRGF
jgi:hypothetical protein